MYASCQYDCEDCDKDCAIYDEFFYRAEYDLEVNIRVKPNTNMDETQQRVLGNRYSNYLIVPNCRPKVIFYDKNFESH